jgi:hypothetical protein
MLKWKLMLTTLPMVAVVWAIKLGLRWGAGFEGVVDFSDIGVVLTAGVFLTGFLLTGTMADYKESEKLPGELAATLETLEEILLQASVSRGGAIAVAPLKAELLSLSQGLHDWLLKKVASPFAALSQFDLVLQQLERDGAGGYASRALSELHNLRKTCTRISVISRTGFLPPAYALLETLLVIIIGLLIAARYKTMLAETILVPFITLLYMYMLRLIRDVDDPFDYAPDGTHRGGAEVELFPLTEYVQRLKARG